MKKNKNISSSKHSGFVQTQKTEGCFPKSDEFTWVLLGNLSV